MICLDTNAVIAAVNQRKPSVRRRLEQALVDRVTVGIPTVVLYEMWYGIRKSMRPQANTEVLGKQLAPANCEFESFRAHHFESA